MLKKKFTFENAMDVITSKLKQEKRQKYFGKL